MEKNEMIEIIMKKANISKKEAEEILEKCNWDFEASILYLEQSGKINNNENTTIIEVKETQYKSESTNEKEEKFGGIGEVVGRIFKFIGKLMKKGNENFFEVRKENEKPIRISITVMVILGVLLTVPVLVLLVIGLFCGYKYSLSGAKTKFEKVNDVFEEASKSAGNIKKDFKKGYES